MSERLRDRETQRQRDAETPSHRATETPSHRDRKRGGETAADYAVAVRQDNAK